MDKVEIVGIVVVIIASTFAYYSFLEQIEPLQFVSSFLVGAFTTYVVQHRLQVESEKRRVKREDALTMRDEVYGPIFMEMSKILETIEQAKEPGWEITSILKDMKAQYLFYKMKRDLKNKFYSLVERLDVYQTIYSATELLLLRKIKEAIKESYGIDVGVSRGIARLGLDIVKDAVGVGSIMLEQALIQRMHPTEFIKAKKEAWGEDIFIEVTIGREKKNTSNFESLYETVLRNVEKESLYQKEKKQREALITELKTFLRQIEDFVVVV